MFRLKAMSKAKDLDEKETHSRILKNVSESLGIFFDLAGEMMPLDLENDSDEDHIPF